MTLVIVLSVIAALLFARAAILQQQGIRSSLPASERADAVQITRHVSKLLAHRVWLIGWVTNLAGFICQAAALHLGSVAIVQPLLTSQLLFTLALVSWQQRIFPGLRAWLGAAAISGGLALLLAVEGTPLTGVPDRTRVLAATLAAAVAVSGLVIASRVSTAGALLSAIAAGLCFAMSAVFMKLTIDDLLTVGVSGTARDWPGYCLALSTLGGLLIGQAAFAGESITWAVAAMNITNPIASYLAGVLAFDVALPTDPGALAGIAGAGLLLVFGVSSLAQVPSLLPESRPGAAAAREREAPRLRARPKESR